MLEFNTYKDILSKEDKDSEEYLVHCIDNAIAELVREKEDLKKAYNYYNGVRDKDQFLHLEENYGIGNPTSIEFIPLIRRHVDALIGEHLQNKIKPKVSCKDHKTLTKIERQKQLAIYQGEIDKLRTQFQTNVEFAFAPQEDKEAQQAPVDVAVERELDKLKDEISRSFVSEFELAAHYVLLHLIQSKSVDLYHKLKTLFLDMLVAGQCFYKVTTRHKGEVPHIEVLDVFNTFMDMNLTSPYVKSSPRVVVRKWLYKDQILNAYGHHFTDTDYEKFKDMTDGGGYADTYFIRGSSRVAAPQYIGTDVGLAIDGDSPYNNSLNLIPVYEVEWLTTNRISKNGKTIHQMDRYKGVRIGEDLYVDMGLDEDAIRSIENPYECFNSVNGIFYSNRNGKPYSLVLATANLQDKYDILHFYRDNLIANSGVNGDWVDVANLPTFLGATPEERLMKFTAYKKQGIALINTAQEGRGSNHNTVFSGFKDAVDGNSIGAIQLAIQQTEEICSSITGVFRERLGAIEQKDAVTNVEVGIKQSAIITKQYYQVMDNITTELLIDSLNACKESYRSGMVGSVILGDKMQKIFSIQPEHFSFTDYDVHIADSGDIIRDMQKIEMITMELVKGGAVEIDVVLEGITSESMTEMKENVLNAYKKKKEENNQLQAMEQQLTQAQEQMKQLQQQAQKLQFENESLKGKNLQIEEARVNNDYEVRTQTNTNNKDFNDKKIELDKTRIELEKLQLFDENPANDEIKNV